MDKISISENILIVTFKAIHLSLKHVFITLMCLAMQKCIHFNFVIYTAVQNKLAFCDYIINIFKSSYFLKTYAGIIGYSITDKNAFIKTLFNNRPNGGIVYGG